MKKMKLNAENWIDGDVEVAVYERPNTVTIKCKILPKVMVRWGTVGPRSRDNKPRWLVYVEGSLNPDIRIHADQHAQCMYSRYMDVEREHPWGEGGNIAEAAAITAWKIAMSTY